MNLRRIAWGFAAVIVLAAGGSVRLYAQPKLASGQFGAIGAAPAYIVVNTPAQVVFTAQITDRQLKKRSVLLIRLDASGKPSDIVGRLRDDGKNGDLKPDDNVYSHRASFNEPGVGPVKFQVAARFKPGRWAEPESDDDDWDKELSFFKQSRRERPAEMEHLARLLKRLGRYTVSPTITLNIWQQSGVTGAVGTTPPDWVTTASADSFVVQRSSNSEGNALSVRVFKTESSETLDEWVETRYLSVYSNPGVVKSEITTARGYRSIQIYGFTDRTDDSILSFIKVSDVVCLVGAAPYGVLKLEYEVLLNTLQCGQ